MRIKEGETSRVASNRRYASSRVEERRSLSYNKQSPFPLSRGRGIKRDGVTK